MHAGYKKRLAAIFAVAGLVLGSGVTAVADESTTTSATENSEASTSTQEEQSAETTSTDTTSTSDTSAEVPSPRTPKLGTSEKVWNYGLGILGSSTSELGDSWPVKLIQFIFSLPPLAWIPALKMTDYRALALFGPFVAKETIEDYCPDWRNLPEDKTLTTGTNNDYVHHEDICNRGNRSTWAERWQFFRAMMGSSAPNSGDTITPVFVIDKSEEQLAWEEQQREKWLEEQRNS